MSAPPGYTTVAAARVRAAIRLDLASQLAPWLLAARLEIPADAERVGAGRGATWRTIAPDGSRVVVRICHRGGVVGRFVRETYLGLRPRPFAELAVTAEARRRGVPAAEIVGVRVAGGLLYRGAVVTIEVPASTTLIEALRATPDGAARCRLAAAAGRAVAALHAAGVFHADLNLTNILVHPGPGGVEATLVDFDRARLRGQPLDARGRRQNLHRLARSLRKLDPRGALAGTAERRAFGASYAERLGDGERRCAS